MVQLPTVSEADTRDALVQTPLDDYELVDFGNGRKLERWGEYLVESLDRQAVGEPDQRHWSGDWIYVADLGMQGHWEPTRSGLPREWTVTVAGQAVLCRLDDHGRVAIPGREFPCADWVRQRIEGCYDIDDIRVLNLFAGSGYVTAQAMQAGASVVHVDASAALLDQARAMTGDTQVEYMHEDVMDYIEELLRQQQRFDVVVLPVPPVGHGPRGQMWDREVDMAKLVKYLPRLVTKQCLGVWLSTDSGAINWKAEGLGQLLGEISPIEDSTGNRLALWFIDYEFRKPHHTEEECRQRDLTYSAPLYVRVQLLIKETGEIKEQEIFFGDIPLMTAKGTFITSGAERVVVSQLIRSPGVYFTVEQG